MRYRLVSAGAAVVFALVLLTLMAPIVARYDPTTMDTNAPLKGPGLAHFFGTDNFGRDVYSRTLYGYRASLTAGVGPVIIALVFGIPLGLVAGYLGSLVDNLIMRTM